jgi:outer membrane receptor for ferrienterochelin and colicins
VNRRADAIRRSMKFWKIPGAAVALVLFAPDVHAQGAPGTADASAPAPTVPPAAAPSASPPPPAPVANPNPTSAAPVASGAGASVEAEIDVEAAEAAALAAAEKGEVIVVTGTRSTATRRESPISTRVISRDQIEGAGAQTAAQALAMQPGVWIQRGLGGAEASLHGLGGKYVLVLVDGQRQIGRVDGVLDLDRLSTADVQQIEVVGGPSSALYGSDALGGVINLVRRVPTEDRLHLTTRYDTNTSSDVAGDATLVTERFYVSGTGQWRRGPSFDRDESDPSTTISEYDEWRGGVRGGYKPASGWLQRVELEGKYTRRDLRGVDSQAAGAVFDRQNLVEESGARASASFADAKHSLTVTGGVSTIRDQFLYDQRGSTALDKDEETNESLIESNGVYERVIADAHRASVGAEVMYETLESPRLSRDGDRTRFGVFAQDQWALGRVVLVPAVRLDADSQFGSHVTPRLAAMVKLNDRAEVRASAGFGYRAPSFKELYLRFENPGVGYVVEGNPDLEPETSRAVSVDFTTRPTKYLALEASAAFNQLKSQITEVGGMPDDSGTLRFSYGNIARARTVDAEVHAALLLLETRLRVEAGFAVTHARDLDADEKLYGVPPRRTQLAVRWRDDQLGLNADAELAVTGPRRYPGGSGTIDTGDRLDTRARVAKSFMDEALSLFLGVDNLLDEGDSNYDPLAPRTAYIGISATR